jgi:hypothetical protein
MVTLADLPVHHYFGGGVYAKETLILGGHKLIQHKHKFEHLSILAYGDAIVNGEKFRGPAVIVMAAEVPHEVISVTDCVWYCIHATEETDPEKIKEEMILP